MQVVHQSEERCRVRVPALKGRPALAAAVAERLRRDARVASVRARPVTATVVLRFDAATLGAAETMQLIKAIVAELEQSDASEPTSPWSTAAWKGSFSPAI